MAKNILERNNVRVFGRGPQTMMFAHGFGCDQNMWRYVAPAFEHEFQIVLFDYVGSGKSDLNAYSVERYASLDGYAQDVLEICDALALTNIIFVGHSVSSMIGILAAIRAPYYFDRLVLIAPSPCYINDLPEYIGGFERVDIEGLLDIMDKNPLGWAGFLAPMVMRNEDRPELSLELQSSFCATDPAIARRFAEATFFSDYRSVLPNVPVSSLILQCADDLITPVEVGGYLHCHLPGSTLQYMKATGHCPHVSHPDETICLIQGYLSAAYTS